jgi:hypothetical protein
MRIISLIVLAACTGEPAVGVAPSAATTCTGTQLGPYSVCDDTGVWGAMGFLWSPVTVDMIQDAGGSTADARFDHLDVASLAATGCRFGGSYYDHVARCAPTFPADSIAAGRARYAGDACPAAETGGFLIDPTMATPIEVRGFECIAAYMRGGPCTTSTGTTSEEIAAALHALAQQCEPII